MKSLSITLDPVMSILNSLKAKLSAFWGSRKRQPRTVTESDGPFRYQYIAINNVLGATLPDDSPDPVEVAHFPEANATAFLTTDWDQYYAHIDRGNAVGTLMLTAFVGVRPFKRLSRKVNTFRRWIFGAEWVFVRNLEREAEQSRERRLKDHSGSGCCLVYQAEGDIEEPMRLSRARIFGDIGFGIDVVDRGAIRSKHESNVRSLATSVSIAMADTNGSPEIRFLTDSAHMIGKDGLVIYLRAFQAGLATLVITTLSSDELISSVESYVAKLSNDRKLTDAASLFAQSQQKSNDNLRSFIASWSAFELLIFNLEKQYRTEWQELLQSKDSELPEWDVDLVSLDIEDYRLRDRFYAVACTINLENAKEDTEKFAELNSKRNDYYHRLEISDTDLPTLDVQNMFRKYMKLVLSM